MHGSKGTRADSLIEQSLIPGECVRLILADIRVTKEALLSLPSKAKDDFDLWG